MSFLPRAVANLNIAKHFPARRIECLDGQQTALNWIKLCYLYSEDVPPSSSIVFILGFRHSLFPLCGKTLLVLENSMPAKAKDHTILVAIIGAAATIIVGVLGYIGVPGHSDPKVDYTFIVRSVTRQPLPDVEVSIAAGHGVPQYIRTDSEGLFNVSLPENTLNITLDVDTVGYLPYDRVLQPSRTGSQIIELTPTQTGRSTNGPGSPGANGAHGSSNDSSAVAAYIASIGEQSDPEARAALVYGLDTNVPPDLAVPVAIHYAIPAGSPADATEQPVIDAAVRVLGRLKESGRRALLNIRQQNELPDSDIAGAILGDQTKVRVRISGVDDFADLSVNGVPVGSRLTFGQDSGWLDITSDLSRSSPNALKMLITNGPAGGFGGRLQISAGTDQYDSGAIDQNRCPCNAPAFDIESTITFVNGGAPRISATKVTFF